MALSLSRRRWLCLSGALGLGCRAGMTAHDGPEARDVRLSGGVTLHTLRLGSRRRPVRWLVHGGPGLDHTYLRGGFDDLAAEARLRYLDLRGHGRSSPPPDAGGYTLTAAADDLAALAAALGESAIDLVAHDFGAAVAMLTAARHPGLLRSLALIAPLRDAAQLRAVGPRSEAALGPEGWRAVQALTTPQGTLRDPHDLGLLFTRLGPMWWSRLPGPEAMARLTREVRYRPEADANFLQDCARWDARRLAPEVRCQTLVVAGADDRTFLPEECRALADALPHGQFALIPGAGHLPFVEQPALLRQTLRRFWGPGVRS